MKHSPLRTVYFVTLFLFTFFVEKSFSMGGVCGKPVDSTDRQLDARSQVAQLAQEKWRRSRSREGEEGGGGTFSRGSLASEIGGSQKVAAAEESDDEEMLVADFEEASELFQEKVINFSATHESNPFCVEASSCLERIQALRSKAESALIETGRITIPAEKNAYTAGLKISELTIARLQRRLQQAKEEKPTEKIDPFQRVLEEFQDQEKEMKKYFNRMIEDAQVLHRLEQELMAKAIIGGRAIATHSSDKK